MPVPGAGHQTPPCASARPDARVALNRGFAYGLRADAADDGRPLAEVLAARYPHSSAATWHSRADAGEITVGGRRAPGDLVVRAGQRVVWERPPWDEPDVPLTFSVIHEDADLVVVDKPAGLPTMPAGGFLEHTLYALLRARYGRAAPAHRLGRHTSGLVLCTRTPGAAAAVAAAWRAQQVTKTYRAVLAGAPPWQARLIATPIGPVPHARLGRLYAASAAGRPAQSQVRVIERRGDTTLCEIDIATGRPHQIRIHVAAAGHPLAGDPLYGPGGVPAPDSAALPGDGGYELHALRLALRHPATGAPVTFVAPAPDLLRVAGDAGGD